ncbi:MAG: hypothetical protein A3H97_01685 [Acidobacteria bacterium RIFCSPLOWO2_02_FULL_65_29]|nr:MAG: hypothetical protein A3H97_01685 [Acidobacteria bacterium RIFCSPLOWO2_02_FULL_65_29]
MNVWAIAGLIVMVLSQAATLAGLEPFASWNTPIAWTGFIVFADSLVWQARGRSWLRSSPGEFAFLAIVSIPLWLVFEFFNLYLDNWYYVGLPEHAALRLFGYAWSFATIWPAIFEAADLIGVWRGAPRAFGITETDTYWVVGGTSKIHAGLSIAIGAAMLAAPFVVSPSVARYLAAPVWLGFILLLDPVNRRMGSESLAGDLSHGQFDRLKNLILSGFLCGILWELWNYWARAKWHYTVPIMENLKIFEMPVPGYLGFPAFALECFTMYVFTRTLFARVLPGPGRAIGVPIAR